MSEFWPFMPPVVDLVVSFTTGNGWPKLLDCPLAKQIPLLVRLHLLTLSDGDSHDSLDGTNRFSTVWNAVICYLGAIADLARVI